MSQARKCHQRHGQVHLAPQAALQFRADAAQTPFSSVAGWIYLRTSAPLWHTGEMTKVRP